METFPAPVAGIDYTHSRTVLSESGDPAHVAMPGVHRIAALLKRWLLGIHQGAVSGKHLEYYLDEYLSIQPPHVQITRNALL